MTKGIQNTDSKSTRTRQYLNTLRSYLDRRGAPALAGWKQEGHWPPIAVQSTAGHRQHIQLPFDHGAGSHSLSLLVQKKVVDTTGNIKWGNHIYSHMISNNNYIPHDTRDLMKWPIKWLWETESLKQTFRIGVKEVAWLQMFTIIQWARMITQWSETNPSQQLFFLCKHITKFPVWTIKWTKQLAPSPMQQLISADIYNG